MQNVGYSQEECKQPYHIVKAHLLLRLRDRKNN